MPPISGTKYIASVGHKNNILGFKDLAVVGANRHDDKNSHCSRKWIISPVNPQSNNGPYTIQNAWSPVTFYLSVDSGSPQEAIISTSPRLWNITPVHDHYKLELHDTEPDTCVCNLTKRGGPVLITEYHPMDDNPNELWDLEDAAGSTPGPTNTKIIRSVAYSNRVLDGDSKTNSGRVVGQRPHDHIEEQHHPWPAGCSQKWIVLSKNGASILKNEAYSRLQQNAYLATSSQWGRAIRSSEEYLWDIVGPKDGHYMIQPQGQDDRFLSLQRDSDVVIVHQPEREKECQWILENVPKLEHPSHT